MDEESFNIVSAVLAAGILAGRGPKPGPKTAARVFSDVRDELLKTLPKDDLRHLPTYLSQKFVSRRK